MERPGFGVFCYMSIIPYIVEEWKRVLHILWFLWWGGGFQWTLIYIVAFLPLLQNLIPMLQVLFVSVGRAKLIAVRNLIISLARLVAVIIACYVTKDIILIFYVLLVLDIGQIIFFMVSFARLKYSIRIKHTCFKYMKPILAFSIPMAVYLLTNSLSRDLDKYVIHHPGSKRKTLNHDEMFDCGACH